MSGGWLVCIVAGALAAAAPDPNDPNPDPDPTDPDPTDPDPPPPDPPPDPTDPDPPPEPTDPDPPPEPEPVPEPEPEPTDGGGGGDGGVEGPEDGPGIDDEPRPEIKPTPFAQLDVADRASEIELGGDLTIGPVCKDDESAVCNNYRVGLRARLPVTQSSTSGSGRAAIDSLGGLSGSWRVGGVFDWIRDQTSEDSDAPATFTMVSLEAAWGVQTFRFSPDGGVMAPSKETRHSIHTLLRLLYYRYPPRKTRVAPQALIRYDRQWFNDDPVGVLFDDGDPTTPAFTVPTIIGAPVTTPVFAVTVPVLVSIQSGKGRAGKVLSQLGLGPAVSYAAAGSDRGANPFDDVHVLRFESWLYWYPLGKAGQLATSQPNVRVGISPFVDVFVVGREPGEPTTDFGVLAEVKVGVRGYEY